jgi:ubiquinone/menaquinone biosynthesis C-methylase UbiE
MTARDKEKRLKSKTDAYLAKTLYQAREAICYEEKRRRTDPLKWKAEIEVLEQVLAKVPQGSRIVDVACGTGRIFPSLTQMDLPWVGVDISMDMIRQIPIERCTTELASGIALCDAENLPFQDGAFSYAISMRFFNLIPPEIMKSVLKEMARVSTKGLVIEIRFLGDRILIDGTIRFAQKLIHLLRGLKHFPHKHPARKPVATCTGPKRYPLPRFSEFAKFVQAADLYVAEVHPVIWSRFALEPDPLTIVLLKPLLTVSEICDDR